MDFSTFFNSATIEKTIRIAFIIITGVGSIQLVAFMLRRSLSKQLSRQRMMLVSRTVTYTGYVGIVLIVVREMNYDLTALFGAAGIVGIAIGVASQTSIGNIISGLFLIGEKSFEIGDLLRIGDKTGTVYSIDLLSIKIKTFDNLLIRIPNQSVISNELINVTRFPIRRLDSQIRVSFKEDLWKVKSVLESVARENPLCLDEPEPIVIFQSYADSYINITFGVWFEKTNYLAVKNSVFADVQEAFIREGIEVPFTHVSIYQNEQESNASVNR